MSFLSENAGTTRTLLHRMLEIQPLSSPISSNTRASKRSLSSSQNRRLHKLRDTPTGTLLSKQTKTAPAQPKDIGATGQLFVEHYDLLEEGTPRILLKKILQTAPEASVLVPELANSQGLEPVQLQEESKWKSLELQLPEPESSVTVAPRLLVHSRKKRRLRVSEFEQEVNQGLTVASDHTEEQPASANESSVTRSFNVTLATVMPRESVERPGLARKPRTWKRVDTKAFEQGLKDIALTHLPGPGRPTKSCTKSPSQNTPLSAGSMSPGTQNRLWTGAPSQNSRLSAPSVSDKSSISREARAKSGAARQEEERSMDDESKESEEDTEIPGRTKTSVVSELSVKTPEFLRAKRNHSLRQPTSPAPPNTNTALKTVDGGGNPSPGAWPCQGEKDGLSPTLLALDVLPSKLSQAKCASKRAPKRCAPCPRQPRDPDKAALKNYCKVFSYYAKMSMEKSASETLVKCLDQYFRTLCDDLETFAHHAGRKTVLLADLELLMRRQGLVTDDVSLYVLVERYLPLEYRRLLIPCAASGNSVFPDS